MSHWHRLVVAPVLALSAAIAAPSSVAAAGHRITPTEAIAIATNDWSQPGDIIRLDHPRHSASFGSTQVQFRNRRGGPAWEFEWAGAKADGQIVATSDTAQPQRRGQTVSYERGVIEEQYVARVSSVEQRFVVPAPVGASGSDLEITGTVRAGGAFENSAKGWLWRLDRQVVSLGQVTVLDATGSLLSASMSVEPADTCTPGTEACRYTLRYVIDGDALAQATYPVVIDPEIGTDDFQISSMGSDDTRNASAPAIAYNSTNNEYLVVWQGDDDTGALADDEFEIFGQRINAANGSAVGTDDFRISDMGPDGNINYSALAPAVAYNSTNNEYLVVWYSNDDNILLAPFEFEIYGQRIDGATGNEVGTNDFRISDMGTDGDDNFNAFLPAVAYNSGNNEFLVVWDGDDTVNNENEVYAQRINAATGAEVGTNDFRVSNMGPDGDPGYTGQSAAVAYSASAGEYLIVWAGDDDVAPLVNGEFEIFGQRLTASTGAAVGSDDFRISDMGPDGSATFAAADPTVVYNSIDNEFLVAWSGDDNTSPLVNNEFEIFGQRVSSAGADIGTNDFRISDMGPDGSTQYAAFAPNATYNPDLNEYIVSWFSDDDVAPVVNDESEIFTQRIDGASGAEVGINDFRISSMGPDSFTGYSAAPAGVYDTTDGQYLIVWEGSDDGLDGEIFGQRLGDCGSGILDPGEDCEAPFGPCCDPSTCLFKANTESCRSVGSACDAEELCTGTSDTCPADQPATAGTECRAVNGDCDVAEQCDGSSFSCPTDSFAANTVECRSVNGACDVAENCSGSSPNCPADGFVANTVQCRAANGVCDVAENCTGSSSACPADGFVSAGTDCRAVAGDCDVVEQCTGSSPACPADGFLSAGTECRATAGVCDVAEQCTGSSAACPGNNFQPNTVECRATNGVCDIAENCSGSGANCPADSFVTAGTECRSVNGVCDVAEQCTGSNPACPNDGFQTAGTECRSVNGDCDVAEQCTGSSVNCPTDGFAANTVQCRGSVDVCDVAENCSGSSATCPANGFAANTVQCRGSAGICDVAENCTGSAAACPTDSFAANTVECRATNGVCDTAENCSGSSATCPTDTFLPNTTECRPIAGDCDVAENCSGSAAACPTNSFLPNTTECRAVNGDCDVAESCTGSTATCPTDSFLPSTTECRAVAGVCDTAESCTGSSAACPTDAFAPSSTVCRTALPDTCDAQETCTGGAAACPADGDLPDMTPCSDTDACSGNEVCLSGVCTGTAIPGCDESLVGYGAKEPKYDGSGTPIVNSLPENWAVTIDDALISNADPDDPENFVITTAKGMLSAASLNDGAGMPSATAYVRYKAKLSKEGITIPTDGFESTVKHIAREWDLQTDLGTISVTTKKIASVLIPASAVVGGPAPAAPTAVHYVCYVIKPNAVVRDQTPGGVFAADLQAYTRSPLFDECLNDQSGSAAFPGTTVESTCLLNIKKATELCNPMSLSAVDPPRTSSATITPAAAQTERSLLCYKPALASAFKNASSAALGGGTIFESVDPKQSKVEKHTTKNGNPVNLALASSFDDPEVLDAGKHDRVCIPATVLSVTPAP